LSRQHSRVKAPTRAKFANAFETCSGRLRIRGANGKSVAGRPVKRRIVAVGEDRFSQDASERLLDFNLCAQKWP
jgi:hypothetical protein